MSFRIINAGVIEGLRQIPADSIHCVVTSPPYWSLRDYGMAGQLGLEETAEEYIENMVEVFREVRQVMHPSASLWMNMGDSYASDAGVNRSPTTLAGNRVPSGWTNRAQPQRAHAIRKKRDIDPKRGEQSGGTAIYKGVRPQGYLKPKDMCMMPARLAIALQQDGWYLRCQIPWAKANGMPESVYDRPTSMVEYIYMLSKSESCFYDREAVRMKSSPNSHSRGDGVNPKAHGPNSRMAVDRDPSHQTPAKIRAKQNRSFSAAVTSVVSTRARRNSDWLFSSIEDYRPEFSGLIVDENFDPLSMMVNPQPFGLEMCENCSVIYSAADYRRLPENDKGRHLCVCGAVEWVSHFATFPERLVTPCLLAGSSEHGCCAHCGAPYERIVEKQTVGDWHPNPATKNQPGSVNGSAKWAKPNCKEARAGDNAHSFSNEPGAHWRGGPPAPATLGWQATCSHPLFPCGVVPCRVLDPFAGSGRTGLVATRHGRNFVGVELNPRYAAMAQWAYEQQNEVVVVKATA